MSKKAPRISSGALLRRTEAALLDFNKFRIAGADYPLRIYKAVHVNCHPAAVHEHEVRVPDQPEMVRAEPLDEELFRMPPKTEHFAVTRPELLLVHRRRLTRAPHVGLARVGLARAPACARARTRPRLIRVHVLSTTLNVRLSTDGRARLRFCLRFARLRLLRAHLLPFHRRGSLRVLRLLLRLRLLRVRCLA